MPALPDPQHERFALAYAGHRNSTKAALEAGFASHLGQDLLGNRGIRARVRELWGDAMENAGAGPERVIQELCRVAFASVRDLVDATTGDLIKPHELTDDVAATVAGLEVETRWEKDPTDPEGGARPITTTKYKRVDKMAALTLLAKHFKVVGDEGQAQSAMAGVLAEALAAGRRRAFEAAREQATDANVRHYHVPHGEDPVTGEPIDRPGLPNGPAALPEPAPATPGRVRVVESRPERVPVLITPAQAAAAAVPSAPAHPPARPSPPEEQHDDLV